MLNWNVNAVPQTGTFNINNGANCNNVTCPNCNGSKYDVAFRDPNTLLEVIEVDFGWTQASTNGPACGAGAVLNVVKSTPAGNPPAGYQFADPGVSWTATVNSGAANPVACTYANPDPNEANAIIVTMSCYKYEWVWTHKFAALTLAQAQATLRWGTKVNGVWTVNDNVNVGYNTYNIAENKILISVPALVEAAVFVGAPPVATTKANSGISVTYSLLLAALLVFFQFFL